MIDVKLAVEPVRLEQLLEALRGMPKDSAVMLETEDALRPLGSVVMLPSPDGMTLVLGLGPGWTPR